MQNFSASRLPVKSSRSLTDARTLRVRSRRRPALLADTLQDFGVRNVLGAPRSALVRDEVVEGEDRKQQLAELRVGRAGEWWPTA
jgi:hypothetical protein